MFAETDSARKTVVKFCYMSIFAQINFNLFENFEVFFSNPLLLILLKGKKFRNSQRWAVRKISSANRIWRSVYRVHYCIAAACRRGLAREGAPDPRKREL
jgi:hypothetical protein